MTDFIVYISAQQRMQAAAHHTEAANTPRSGPGQAVRQSRISAVRQRISVVLYQLAQAIQPMCEPTSGVANAPR